MTKPKKNGRPYSKNPKTKNVTVRFTESELADFEDYVEKKEMNKSALIRDYVLKVIGRKK